MIAASHTHCHPDSCLEAMDLANIKNRLLSAISGCDVISLSIGSTPGFCLNMPPWILDLREGPFQGSRRLCRVALQAFWQQHSIPEMVREPDH